MEGNFPGEREALKRIGLLRYACAADGVPPTECRRRSAADGVPGRKGRRTSTVTGTASRRKADGTRACVRWTDSRLLRIFGGAGSTF